MKAVRNHVRGGPEGLVYEDVPQPQPGNGEVLVRVNATGVTPMELTWSTNWQTATGGERQLAIPGHELSGVIAQSGPGVTGMVVGTPVYGLTDFYRDGAEAEYTIALPSELAPKPQSLDHLQAASVPLSALTAWEAFFDYAKPAAGQTILIHGAAGGVGTFAVQIARKLGMRVVGTASTRNQDFLRDLGCDVVIDYTSTRFEDVVHGVDLVFDGVGGDTLERSWTVLKSGGTLISVAAPPSAEQAAAHDVHAVFFIVRPDRGHLMQIGEWIDSGWIRPVVTTVLPLSEARLAYDPGKVGHARGKTVLQVAQ